jgi:hypothetical protein
MDGPQQTVTSFIAAMNAWELRAYALMRAVRDTPRPVSYQTKMTADLGKKRWSILQRRPGCGTHGTLRVLQSAQIRPPGLASSGERQTQAGRLLR